MNPQFSQFVKTRLVETDPNLHQLSLGGIPGPPGFSANNS